jgi:hypothetical protein
MLPFVEVALSTTTVRPRLRSACGPVMLRNDSSGRERKVAA